MSIFKGKSIKRKEKVYVSEDNFVDLIKSQNEEGFYGKYYSPIIDRLFSIHFLI